MRATDGCSPDDHDHTPDHHHGAADDTHHHDHAHRYNHAHDQLLVTPATRTITVEEAVLAKNDVIAAENRAAFRSRDIAAFNFTSSPGSGKTSLLETMIPRLAGRAPVTVIEGDQETAHDADRIRATGAPVVQISAGCHLDAAMVRQATQTLAPPASSLLLIENVGNMVCPALFDLGERATVVLLSVTEGEDKPLKYPHMFRAADVAVLTKIDLLPYLDFDVGACIANVRRVNPALRLFQVSSRDGNGIPALSDWMAAQVAAQA